MADAIELSGDDDEYYYSADERARLEEELRDELTIVEAKWHRTPEFGFLAMKLSNGRRVLIPREELRQLKDCHRGTGRRPVRG